MKINIAFIFIIQLLISSCSKDTPPTSASNGEFQFPGIHISAISVWGDSTYKPPEQGHVISIYLGEVEHIIIPRQYYLSWQYNDTLSIPISGMDARLVVNAFDRNGNDLQISDSIIWYTSNNNLLSFVKTEDSSIYLININSLVAAQSSSIVVPIYCRMGELTSNTMYVQVLYNACRFKYQTLELNSELRLSNIKIGQLGKEVFVSDSAGNIVQMLLFDGSKFKEESNAFLFPFIRVTNYVLDDFTFESDSLIDSHSALKGTYTKKSNNQKGAWSFK